MNASKRLGQDCVTVLLDVVEDNCRVGYGECEGYSILIDGQVAVRACPGLHIGFLLADDEGYIFAMPALMVEDVAKRHAAPNAIRATPDQVLLLIAATKPEFKAAISDHEIPEQNSETPSLFTLSGQNHQRRCQVTMDMDHCQRPATAMDMDQSQCPITIMDMSQYRVAMATVQHLATAMDTGQCRVPHTDRRRVTNGPLRG